MNKIVSSISVSLDGFFEGPDRDIDWHTVDEEVHQHFNDYLRTAGAFVEGRVTYQLMEEFWPTADQDPANDGPMAEFAGIWRDMPKYVYSRTLKSVGPGATLLREVDRDEVCAVRDAAAGDLIVGGADLVETFRRLDLVDEYRVYVHPVLLGRGRPFFGEAADRQGLRLLESRTFGNGVVLLRYETDPAPADA
ncbi:dihydrofolate reductase family protein [Streptomyces sp. ME02-6991-2A]|uniref:dihydrofolate reductase family protein n=1 Tax=Streptomyces sp. ME02-6991-2A TaxID=3028677 RepID=UPI00299FB970|nr:dihydrofolate reductase family protein [Streptomyces sp. ME02-6991-2A]MDX3379664.1 dihydrofolate reductase family protein [Streptomyces sp. ME02-6991-2A]